MGVNRSNLTPMPQGFEYTAITLRDTDTIRIIYPTQEEVNAIRNTIKRHWASGIKKEKQVFGSGHEFQLRGDPFEEHKSVEESINTCKLCCHMLFRLYNMNCKLLFSSDLSQTCDLSTWVFHREQTQLAQFNFACIGVSSTDKLQFVNFPASMHQMFQGIVQKNWGQTEQHVEKFGDALQITLNGNPWISLNRTEDIQSKTLIKALINGLGAQRWLLYGSSNIGGKVNTLFFKYKQSLPTVGSKPAEFVMSFSGHHCMRLVDSPQDAISCVKVILSQCWFPGFEAEHFHPNLCEFRLIGNPWWTEGQEGVDARFLVCKIFEGLMSIGWRVQIAMDLSRNMDDKSVLTFQRAPPIMLPVFCLSLHYTDQIRIINAPPDTGDALSRVIRSLWTLGVASELQHGASIELKLNGNPWSYGFDGHDSAHGCALLLHLLKWCANLGWFVILSADVSSRYHKQSSQEGRYGATCPLDVHSWWFVQLGGLPETNPSLPAQFRTGEYDQQGTGMGPEESYAVAPGTDMK